MLRGRLIMIAVLGALAAVVAVSPALAGHQKVKHFATKVSIKTNKAAGTITGKVTSTNEACSAKRKIKLNVDGDDVFTTKAKADGTYGIRHKDSMGNTIPLDSGAYEVHSGPLQLSAKKVCDPGDSKISHVS